MNQPNFWSPDFLTTHIRHTMAFYDPRALDPRGGFFHFFKDDGTIYDRHTRHLVSSTRFVFTQAMAYLGFGEKKYLETVKHGLAFLKNAHFDPVAQGYAWTLSVADPQPDGTRPITVTDPSRQCYGMAFVMLAHACGLACGIESCRTDLENTFAIMEKRFFLPEFGAYASEATHDWKLSSYRGQNDNMHACEALLAAFEASKDTRYLDRAALLADTFTNRLAAQTGGQVWEHFTAAWQPDLHYNKGDRSNIFRPWGFQTGHQAEWAKLLLILDQHRPAPAHLTKAKELFAVAMKFGWDHTHGGLRYGYDMEGAPYDDDKYFWVQAESLATAAMLHLRTGDLEYKMWYEKIWAYSWEHFVDHQHGAWFRILSPDNKKVSDEKSPAGKVDYHTMGACWQVLSELKRTGK